LALALLLIFLCKSKHMKSVGKVAIVPSLFTITEPMKFGIPMVLNPWLLLPMSLSAVVCELIAYGASVIGFLPVVSVNVGRTLPPIISGLVACGWQGAVIKLIQLVIVILMYIPFLRKVDRDALKKEAEPKEEQLKA
jgi:PTS system cellobiose-specific IIC component